MGRQYFSTGSAALLTSPGITIGELVGNTERAWVKRLDLDSTDSPADQWFRVKVLRATGLGTAGFGNVNPLNPTDPAAALFYEVTFTIEPTYTANSELLDLAFNMKCVFTWKARPGGEFVRPGTVNAGIGVRGTAQNNSVVLAAAMTWEE